MTKLLEAASGTTIPQWDKIPEELKAIDKWIVYNLVWEEDKQKYTKPPHTLDGARRQSLDIHYSFDEARRSVDAKLTHGLGFAMSKEDGLICIDLDGDSLDDIPKALKSFADHSYAELSPSGNGIHVWFKGDKPKGAGGKQNRYNKEDGYKIECFYDTGYLTVTGNAVNDLLIEENQMILDFIYDSTNHSSENKVAAPIVDIPIPLDEKEDGLIVELLLKSRNNGEKNKALLNGDTSHHGNDQSAADLALCNSLAIHTKCNAEQIDRIYRTTELMRDKWDAVHHSNGETYGEGTINKAIEWAYPNIVEDNYLIIFENGEESPQYMYPEPFVIEHGMLKKKVTIKDKATGLETEKTVTVCRHAPVISQSFSNLEKNQTYYELQWVDNGRKRTEVVPAGDLSTKNRLLQLADKGLGVTDANTKELIIYFNSFIMFNQSAYTNLAERLGHIRNEFIHPLMSDVKILPPDLGEQQTMDAFQVKGTPEEWIKHVYEKVKHYPKAMLMVLASFASVILKDLKLAAFIVDLSGPTSRGKTTALRIAASVWGTEFLVNEWNTTKVAVERKAAFLNSFPLLMDDTMKADERHLKGVVYNHSGGRSKGRGSIAGSQVEYTWNNIIISTGETPLTEYAKEAAGAAARVLPITGLPFEDADYNFFTDIYDSIDDHHGAIGVDFLKKWEERKDELLPFYKEYNDVFQKKSNGNDVLGRIARHYAAIVFTGKLMIEFFDVEIDLMELEHLFDVMIKENTAIDKPMERLEEILVDLDSKRDHISSGYEAKFGLKAIYKNEILYLFPAYLKEVLGVDMSATRKEWSRRNISTGVKGAGAASLTHLKKTYRVVPIGPEILAKLGFDFSEA